MPQTPACPSEKCSSCIQKQEGLCAQYLRREEVVEKMFVFPMTPDFSNGEDMMTEPEFNKVHQDYMREVDAQARIFQLWTSKEEMRLSIISNEEQVWSQICRKEVV